MFVNLIKRKTTPNLWAGVSLADQNVFLNDKWEHNIKKQFLNDNRRTWLVELPVSSSGSISDRR
jgi:hypothetical protein